MNFFDIGSYKAESSKLAFENSEQLIAEYMLLLENQYCLRVGLSCGKDSSVVWNAAIEAMERSIGLGTIDYDHPIVAVTVDTKLEPESIQCYVPFAHKAIRERCDKAGINLFMEIVQPPLHQELMILFANAQKLFATASSGRSADCSIEWKINSSIKALRQIKRRLPQKYQESIWISISGSRSEESSRRSNNMLKQGVRSLKASSLIEQIKADREPAGTSYKFAPISDWTTKDVISYLTHAGSNAIAKTSPGQRISAYGENFGLLLAIYGEGSSDACEIVALDDKKVEQKGCGKVARFGCVTCGMVGENHSAVEMEKYDRWSRFGDGTRRFRDYLTRVSDDLNNRAFHARAYDPSGNNNVFLQPNVLKAKVLEKMVWYASQISVDSRKIHEDFVKLYEAGDAHLDIGIQDIMKDDSLTGSVRSQYVDMYTQRMLAGPMFEMFSTKHAVLLSLLWSYHGVAALPYRPLAIFNEVVNGKRIPFPLTNKELDAKRARHGMVSFREELKSQKVPDALVAQLFTPAKKSFAEMKELFGDALSAKDLVDFMPFSLVDSWEKEDISFEQNHGFSMLPVTKAQHVRKFKLEYTLNTNTGAERVKAKCAFTNKVIDVDASVFLRDSLINLGRNDYASEIEAFAQDKGVSAESIVSIRAEAACDFTVSCTHEFSNQKAFTSSIECYSNILRSRPAQKRSFSERKRVFNKSTGKYVATRSSLKMYSAAIEPAMHEQSVSQVKYWVPDSSQVKQVAVGITEYQSFVPNEDDVSAFSFDDEIFDLWVSAGGPGLLIAEHDKILLSRIKHRQPVRSFFGTGPVYKLTSGTGLTISARSEDRFSQTLRRTEVFNRSGILSLAGLSYEKISQQPGIVTMRDHRKQKVQILLAIRFLRNKQRKIVKTAMVSKSHRVALRSVTGRMQEFMQQYEIVAKSYLCSAALSPFGINGQLRKDKLSIWLNEFGFVLKDVKGMVSLLATAEEREMLEKNFDAMNALADAFSNEISVLNFELSKFVSDVSTRMVIAKKIAENDVDSVTIIGNEYSLCEELKDHVSCLSNWIKSHYPETNTFLMSYGFGVALAQIAKCDHIDLFTVSQEANSVNRKELRKERSLFNWNKAISEMNLATHDCLDGIVMAKANEMKSKAIGQLSAKVKTKKLMALLAA